MFTAVISIPVVLIGIESGWVKNLVQNSSFEKGGDQSAKSWNTSTWSGDPIFRIDPGAGRTGNRSAAITSILGADASWSFRLQVKPNTDYRVSAWIKTDKLAGGGLGATAMLLGLTGRRAARAHRCHAGLWIGRMALLSSLPALNGA